MSWESQGHQDHGWFGHGTASGSPAPASEKAGRSAAPSFLDQRITRVVGILLVHFSPAERKHAALSPQRRSGETRSTRRCRRQSATR